MDTNELLRRSADLINRTDALIGEQTLPHNKRTTTSAILCSLGRQHHRAVIRLVESDLPASALALLRVLFECYVRALWLHECATDAEVDDAINDKWPRLPPMVQAIEGKPQLQNGVLARVVDTRWRAFNSFTHNGAQAFALQIRDREIGPRFSVEDVRDIIGFSDSINLMIAGQMAVLAEDAKLAQSLLAEVKAYSAAN